MERAAFAGVLDGTDEVDALVNSDDAIEFADLAHRLAEVLMWNGEFGRSLELYHRVFDDLLPRGAAINEPEALIWYTFANFWEGGLDAAAAIAERARKDLDKGRSVHTRSHVMGGRALVMMGRGDWTGLLEMTNEFETMLAEHPDAAFCLLGAAAIGYGATARLVSDIALPNDLARDAAQMVEGSTLIQASSVMLPEAILGDLAAVDRGSEAYAPGLRLFDRANVSDVLHLIPALSAVMTERWDAACRADGAVGVLAPQVGAGSRTRYSRPSRKSVPASRRRATRSCVRWAMSASASCLASVPGHVSPQARRSNS